MSELSDFILPARNTLIVLPDEGKTNKGTIVKSSPSMSGLFIGDELPYAIDNHVIYLKEATVDIELDGTNYLLMNRAAIMGALE